jgi:hypothetical protein
MRETFRRLMYTAPGEWKRADLVKLQLAELRGLCELLGVPVSGTKAECVERLLSLGGLRHILADSAAYADYADYAAYAASRRLSYIRQSEKLLELLRLAPAAQPA